MRPAPFASAAMTGVCSPTQGRSRLIVTASLAPRIIQGDRTSSS